MTVTEQHNGMCSAYAPRQLTPAISEAVDQREVARKHMVHFQHELDSKEYEIYSTVSLEQARIIIMIAVSAQLTFFGWMRPDSCLVIRDLERQSDLHPEYTIEGGGVLTVGDKLLGCARGASVRPWFCRYVASI